MAGVTAWTIATVGFVPPLLLALVAAGRGSAAGRLVAVQLATTIGILAAIGLTFMEDQPSSIDLALALALLTFPATLLFALFEERWL